MGQRSFWNEKSKERYFFEIDFQYSKDLQNEYSKWMKIENVEKLAANLHGKKYIIHIMSLKQALNYGLVF